MATYILAALYSAVTLYMMGLFFDMMGERWYAAMIPVYRLFVLTKIAGGKKVWFGFIGSMITAAAGGMIATNFSRSIPALSDTGFGIMVIGLMAYIVCFVLSYLKLCDDLVINRTFAAGLLLLPPVFFGLLCYSPRFNVNLVNGNAGA